MIHKLELNKESRKPNEHELKTESPVGDVYWSDHKKRDRLREKELLQQAR